MTPFRVTLPDMLVWGCGCCRFIGSWPNGHRAPFCVRCHGPLRMIGTYNHAA